MIMTIPEIIGSARSTYVQAVRMVCEEKGIDYVWTETALRAPEIRAIHPFGKMPVLRHGDFHLFESQAITSSSNPRHLPPTSPATSLLPSSFRQMSGSPHSLSNGSRWSTR